MKRLGFGEIQPRSSDAADLTGRGFAHDGRVESGGHVPHVHQLVKANPKHISLHDGRSQPAWCYTAPWNVKPKGCYQQIPAGNLVTLESVEMFQTDVSLLVEETAVSNVLQPHDPWTRLCVMSRLQVGTEWTVSDRATFGRGETF
ncbi:MAG: hypothetical protein WAV54_03660 [Acidimicrobiales bacterium]